MVPKMMIMLEVRRLSKDKPSCPYRDPGFLVSSTQQNHSEQSDGVDAVIIQILFMYLISCPEF